MSIFLHVLCFFVTQGLCPQNDVEGWTSFWESIGSICYTTAVFGSRWVLIRLRQWQHHGRDFYVPMVFCSWAASWWHFYLEIEIQNHDMISSRDPDWTCKSVIYKVSINSLLFSTQHRRLTYPNVPHVVPTPKKIPQKQKTQPETQPRLLSCLFLITVYLGTKGLVHSEAELLKLSVLHPLFNTEAGGPSSREVLTNTAKVSGFFVRNTMEIRFKYIFFIEAVEALKLKWCFC